MVLTLLQTNPALALVWLLAVVLSLTIHEFSHAFVSKLRGDLTAERENRLTLNPLSHIDWVGFIAMLALGFGWAKPVPYNPYNLKSPKWDSVLIAFAGPAANLLFAILGAVILRGLFITHSAVQLNLLIVFLVFIVLLNLFLLIFNIIPIHPLDGSKLLIALFDAPKYAGIRNFIQIRGPQILFILVLLSIMTSFDVFFFVSVPAFLICDGLLGTNCIGILNMIFSM